MHIKFFELDNQWKLTLNVEELLLHSEFATLINADDSENKSEAFKRFKYIYLMCDWQSTFINFTEKDRIKESLVACELRKSDITPDVKRAMKLYIKIRDSNPILRYAQSQKTIMDKLVDYSEEVNFNDKVEEGAHKGKLVHSTRDAQNQVLKMPEMIAAYQQTMKLVEAEKKKEGENRRGGGQAPLMI